jgi:methylated-DNA-protein-cysteine methyltransferase-like protein
VGTREARDERERRIVDVILALQPGEVVSYGDIADVAGYPKQSRLVGRILSTSDIERSHLDLPWWRVVNSSGRLVPGHEREQAALLHQEDVIIRNGHVRTAPHGRFGDG